MVCGVGAALYLLVAVVEGLRGESLIDRQQEVVPALFVLEEAFAPKYIYKFLRLAHLRKKVGVAHLKRKNCSSLQKSHSGWAEGPGGGERI